MSESHETNGLSEFERQLAALQPCDVQLDRAALMYRAGQQSVRSSHAIGRSGAWGWRCAAVFFACLSLAQAWSKLYEPMVANKSDAPTVLPNGFVGESPLAETTSQRMPPGSDAVVSADCYLSQRRLALSEGLDAVGAFSDTNSSRLDPSTYRDLRRQMSLWQ